MFTKLTLLLCISSLPFNQVNNVPRISSYNHNLEVNYYLQPYDSYIGDYTNLSYGNNSAYGSNIADALAKDQIPFTTLQRLTLGNFVFTDVTDISLLNPNTVSAAYQVVYEGGNRSVPRSSVDSCTFELIDESNFTYLGAIMNIDFFVYTDATQLTFTIYNQPYLYISKLQKNFNLVTLGISYVQQDYTFTYRYGSFNRTANFVRESDSYYTYATVDPYRVLYSDATLLNQSQYDFVKSYFGLDGYINYSSTYYLHSESIYDYLYLISNNLNDLGVIDDYTNQEFIDILNNEWLQTYAYDLIFQGIESENLDTTISDFSFTAFIGGLSTDIFIDVFANLNGTNANILRIGFKRVLSNGRYVISHYGTLGEKNFIVYKPIGGTYSIDTDSRVSDGAIMQIRLLTYRGLTGVFELEGGVSFDGDLGQVLELFTQSIKSFTSFFNIVIFPGMSLGTFVLIPLTIGILMFIIGLFKR